VKEGGRCVGDDWGDGRGRMERLVLNPGMAQMYTELSTDVPSSTLHPLPTSHPKVRILIGKRQVLNGWQRWGVILKAVSRTFYIRSARSRLMLNGRTSR
jgi:hypothetical protein